MIDRAIVEKAITPLEAGLASDGIKVAIGKIEGNFVTIRLLVTPETCRECMMPPPIMEQLFQQSLLDEGIQDVHVQVVVVEESSVDAS